MAVKKNIDKNGEEPAVKEESLVKEPKNSKEKYFSGLGRRKASVAQVRLYPFEKASEKDMIVNGKQVKDYFPLVSLQNSFSAPLRAVGLLGSFKISVIVKGGGPVGQTEASRLGISRALVKYDENFKSTLKSLDFLKRDSRVVERKKAGLKKARRAPQWAKR